MGWESIVVCMYVCTYMIQKERKPKNLFSGFFSALKNTAKKKKRLKEYYYNTYFLLFFFFTNRLVTNKPLFSFTQKKRIYDNF